jgi:hypothetical protein
LLLIAGIGGATPAGATGLSVGAGSTVQLGNALLALGCNDLVIEPAGRLEAQASTIRLAGNWDNRGTFDPGTGTVVFENGCGIPEMASIGGSNTFFDLKIITSNGKKAVFEAGSTQTILDRLMLMGAPGNLLVLRSSIPGQLAFLNLVPGAAQVVDYVDVADNRSIGQFIAPGPAATHHSVDSGNTIGWFFVAPPAPAPPTSGVGLALTVWLLLAVGAYAFRRNASDVSEASED